MGRSDLPHTLASLGVASAKIQKTLGSAKIPSIFLRFLRVLVVHQHASLDQTAQQLGPFVGFLAYSCLAMCFESIREMTLSCLDLQVNGLDWLLVQR